MFVSGCNRKCLQVNVSSQSPGTTLQDCGMLEKFWEWMEQASEALAYKEHDKLLTSGIFPIQRIVLTTLWCQNLEKKKSYRCWRKRNPFIFFDIILEDVMGLFKSEQWNTRSCTLKDEPLFNETHHTLLHGQLVKMERALKTKYANISRNIDNLLTKGFNCCIQGVLRISSHAGLKPPPHQRV